MWRVGQFFARAQIDKTILARNEVAGVMLSMQRPRAGQPSGHRNRGVDNCGAMAHQHCYGRAYITRFRVETTALFVGAASKKFRHINAGFFRADYPIVRPFPSVPSVPIAAQGFSARILTGTVEGGSGL
jgi:hypothetical protein